MGTESQMTGVPTGADAVRVSHDALMACEQAANMIRRIGFQLAYTSMRSEACYYMMPGYHGAIRVAAHRLGRTETRETIMPIVAKITFGTNQGLIIEQHLEQRVMLALGRYFYARRLCEYGGVTDE